MFGWICVIVFAIVFALLTPTIHLTSPLGMLVFGWMAYMFFADLNRPYTPPPPPVKPRPVSPPLPKIDHNSLADYVAYRKAHGLPYNEPSMWSDGS